MSRIFAGFVGLMMVLPAALDAAYPVYSAYQPSQNYGVPSGVVPVMNGNQVQYLPSSNSRVVSGPNNVSQYNQYRSVVAAQPTRVTGALPYVGSAQTTAGRSYYQPADYERLADSGLYVGLSVAYTASLLGGINADYTGEQNAFFVPGAFEEGKYHSDTVIPLQISVGAAINNDFRVDF